MQSHDGMVTPEPEPSQDCWERLTKVFTLPAGQSCRSALNSWAGLVTDFERAFQQKGIQTLRAAYRAMPL
jgi:hypothetical protein